MISEKKRAYNKEYYQRRKAEDPEFLKKKNLSSKAWRKNNPNYKRPDYEGQLIRLKKLRAAKKEEYDQMTSEEKHAYNHKRYLKTHPNARKIDSPLKKNDPILYIARCAYDDLEIFN